MCHVCGNADFGQIDVLWDKLIEEWQLSKYEVDYINRQQGLFCKNCSSNLRSIALAKAIVCSYGQRGTLLQFVETSAAKRLRVLEINAAGTLAPILACLPLHKQVTYPAYDMTKLDIELASFDLIVHSDTLEHIENPRLGLSECRRVLAEEGRCIFTAPIIVDRLTRFRAMLPRSYHGLPAQVCEDHIVHTEFGADIWKYVIQAGFTACIIYCVDYPAGLAVEARA